MHAIWMLMAAGVVAQAGAGPSLPAAAAENARVVPPAAARLPLGADGQVDPAALVAAVSADALRQAGAGARVAEVLAPEPVTWNDGALGCPRPGAVYTQALVPGWRIVVRLDDGRRLDYHASRTGAWLRCERPAPPASPVPKAPAAPG
jgi:hypothetical protein